MGTTTIAAAAAAKSSSSSFLPLLIIIVLFGLFYVTIIRPQRNRQRKAQATQRQVMPGQRVRTTAGIYGTVISGDDRDVVVEIAPGVQVTMLRRGIMDVVPEDDQGGTPSRRARPTRTPAEDTEPADDRGDRDHLAAAVAGSPKDCRHVAPSTQPSRPGRLLIVAGGHHHRDAGGHPARGTSSKPGKWHDSFKVGLGLDLSSGTTVTLQAVTKATRRPARAQMNEASEHHAPAGQRRRVQRRRWCSSRAASSSRCRSPARAPSEVVSIVGQTALLRFRQVLLCSAPDICDRSRRGHARPRAPASTSTVAQRLAEPVVVRQPASSSGRPRRQGRARQPAAPARPPGPPGSARPRRGLAVSRQRRPRPARLDVARHPRPRRPRRAPRPETAGEPARSTSQCWPCSTS